MPKLVLASIALFFAVSGPALAQTPAWHVSEVGGDVRIVENGRERPATRGALLSSGAVVATTAHARAVLVRGHDYVVVSPASRVRVPTPQQQGGRNLIQMMTDSGTAMFRIEHQASPHFGVQTPYLAAVVKGTVFTVTVGSAGASVQVTEGAVEVSTVDGGAADLIRPGMIALVSAADLQLLNVQGENSHSLRSNGSPAAGVVTIPSVEAGNYQGPADPPASVSAPIAEVPVPLADATGGLVGGSAGVDLAAAAAYGAARPDVGHGGGNGGHGNHGGGDGGNGNNGQGGNHGGDTGPGSSAHEDHGNNGHDDADHGHGNNGQGNDDAGGDHGNGHGNDDAHDDHGNNGHGNDDAGGDHGNGHGNDDAGGDHGNGHGNDDAGGDHGNGHGNDDAADDHGNNGHGNDDAAGDPGNNGHGNDDAADDHGNGHGNDDAGDDHGGHGGGDDGLNVCLPGDLLCVGVGNGHDGGHGKNGPHG